MNKIKKLIQATGLLIRKPYLLNKVIDDNDAWRERAAKAYGKDQGLPEVSFREFSRAEEVIVNPFAFLEGGSLPTDLGLLKLLAGRFEKCKYFEIGTWRGESVANVAAVADKCFTLNLSAQEMLDLGMKKEYVDQHGMYSKSIANVTHLEGNSLEFDFAALKMKFDLVFIDGDHHFDSIKKDTENVFVNLIHENSIVVWHDYAWQPGNIRYETMAAILEGVPHEERKHLYAVRNTMCAIYYPSDIKAKAPEISIDAKDNFEVKIK